MGRLEAWWGDAEGDVEEFRRVDFYPSLSPHWSGHVLTMSKEELVCPVFGSLRFSKGASWFGKILVLRLRISWWHGDISRYNQVLTPRTV